MLQDTIFAVVKNVSKDIKFYKPIKFYNIYLERRTTQATQLDRIN